MGLNFISSTDYPSKKITEFNVSAANDPQFKEIKLIKDSFIFKEEKSFGKIYQRNDNKDYWYIDVERTIARFITEEQLNLFVKWEEEDLLPSESQFEILSSIGGLPSGKYSIEPKSLRFPAQITIANGQDIDLCIICFTKSPPFQRHFKNLILLNDISKITPSDLALPHDLRLSSILADEIRMSFSPFSVQTTTGEILTYNGVTQFASTGKIKGADVSNEVPFSYSTFAKTSDIPNDDITYIIGKWNDKLDQLFIQYSNRLEEKKPLPKMLPKKSFWERLFKF